MKKWTSAEVDAQLERNAQAGDANARTILNVRQRKASKAERDLIHEIDTLDRMANDGGHNSEMYAAKAAELRETLKRVYPMGEI